MARVRIDRQDLHRAIIGEARRELETSGRLVQNRAKILAPVDTGRLRASIKTRYSYLGSFRPRVRIFSKVKYAKFVHDGTYPHEIEPSRRSVLRFKIGGRWVYARYVDHPGTRPRPFLDDALQQIAPARGYRITDE